MGIPLPPRIFEIFDLARFRQVILGLQQLTGKILSRNDLAFESAYFPLVVIAETGVAHGGRSAVGATQHDVHALVWQTSHNDLPLSLSLSCNQRVSRILRFDLRAAIS